ncbi:MAG: biopolymer transporter ExbD [SAR86 cluster bacterium]|jgi:biopolymer transport protein ExbD|uniref:Biopolymer transporter ExbD n=1 Tax=SAR86 cluster bacterium TaxID=2030880 RepID=A0A520N760_9GAMM|nr:MAG: biopolymer transporter ExbD [SAR86 cluster bacterium]|tara:strand:+ start:1473 stop:1877 length:405 start_codon:yes stop_codon:yes gene_type:complete
MKFISNEKSSFSIEITPLIDIVFLLVIFFVVTSKVGDSQFLSLDLPKTESFEYKTVQSKNEIVIISSGSIYVNDNVFDINDIDKLDQAIFELENSDSSIILSAESDSLHIWVITIMDILNKYGFNEVQIRTIEK